MKKIITIILSIIMCITLSVTVFAYDLLNEAYEKFKALYPDIPYEEIVNTVKESYNQGLDTSKIKEALDSLVSKYTTQKSETTANAQEETTTKKSTSDTNKETTTKKSSNYTNNTNSNSYFNTTKNTNTNSNNVSTTSNSVNIVLPNQTTVLSEEQSTQSVAIYQVQSTTGVYPNLSNTTQANDDNSTSNGLSSKTIMAIVIIAVGGLLLLVSIIVLATSSTPSNAPGRRRKHLKISNKDNVLKGYVPFAQSDSMPEIKVNTAADMALKKKGATSLTDEQSALAPNHTTLTDAKYSLSAFDIPLNTYSADGTVDESTAEAIDAAIAYAAAKASEYNEDYKNSLMSSTGEDSKPNVLTANAILNESVKKDRVCPDCGKFVDESLMFCPECGSFMGITDGFIETEEPAEIIETYEEPTENETETIKTGIEEIQPKPVAPLLDESSFLHAVPVANGRFCPECGATVDDELMFCPECGHYMDE